MGGSSQKSTEWISLEEPSILGPELPMEFSGSILDGKISKTKNAG